MIYFNFTYGKEEVCEKLEKVEKVSKYFDQN